MHERTRDSHNKNSQTYTGIFDQFFKNPRYRETQEKLGLTEASCKEKDELAQEDHSSKVTKGELDRYRSNWRVKLNDP